MLTFPSVPLLAFATATMIAGIVPQTYGHGVEVRECLTEDKLRFFVSHWHGDLSNTASAGTMNIKDETSGVVVTTTPAGIMNNKDAYNPATTDWGCVGDKVPTIVKSCSGTKYHDWVYYEYAAQCNVPVSYTLLTGNTVVLMEACSGLYPATVSLSEGCFESKAPTKAPTNAPTKAPTEVPTNSPTKPPTESPTDSPSSLPSMEPTEHPSDSPSFLPSMAPSRNPSSSPSTSPSSQPSSQPSFESVSHRVCENFAVHARTTVTFDGVTSTIHHGDVGVSPGTSITGAFKFANGDASSSITIDEGELVDDSADFALKVLDAHAEAMEAQSVHMEIEIGGLTFTPGNYRSNSAINFAHGTVVTLDGLNDPNPVFLFIAGSTLVTAADTTFILMNGAKAENVYWALGTAATLGANSVLEGSILAGTAITFGTQSTLHGCALAQSAVTFESEGSVELDHYNTNGQGDASSVFHRHLRG
eukprot:CAMPEP_0201956960 /NCGR_PEP_ID=MMETSP0904-20121228/4365_1 /ASSEMBLY_ACC=CAM_ASM_000553 /TAXON_ID=420261 /ORGANISM="Thalassiosira antarctica, Strain CCMP982" /LENGTH=473 /DNA_ID=CAMNT_0048501749 /DNA_START=74 /DNA_END=1495 /DNA_ORIENTATION=+